MLNCQLFTMVDHNYWDGTTWASNILGGSTASQ